jgi:hypothetical protein
MHWRGALLLGTLPLILGACGHLHMMMGKSNVERPAAEEFGLGPRASTEGLYLATLEPGAPLRPREMRTIRAVVRDAEGRPVDGASIAVDGGMPQHDHGLPTRPRVTRDLGEGTYEIEGVRFNMGGWWEFKLRIGGPAGVDTVTFNLDV